MATVFFKGERADATVSSKGEHAYATVFFASFKGERVDANRMFAKLN